MIKSTGIYKYPLPVLAALIALTANLGISVGTVSLSFLGIFNWDRLCYSRKSRECHRYG